MVETLVRLVSSIAWFSILYLLGGHGLIILCLLYNHEELVEANQALRQELGVLRNQLKDLGAVS